MFYGICGNVSLSLGLDSASFIGRVACGMYLDLDCASAAFPSR